MIQLTNGKIQASLDVFGLEVGQFLQYLLCRQTSRKQLQDVGNADAHPTDTWPAATLAHVLFH